MDASWLLFPAHPAASGLWAQLLNFLCLESVSPSRAHLCTPTSRASLLSVLSWPQPLPSSALHPQSHPCLPTKFTCNELSYLDSVSPSTEFVLGFELDLQGPGAAVKATGNYR